MEKKPEPSKGKSLKSPRTPGVQSHAQVLRIQWKAHILVMAYARCCFVFCFTQKVLLSPIRLQTPRVGLEYSTGHFQTTDHKLGAGQQHTSEFFPRRNFTGFLLMLCISEQNVQSIKISPKTSPLGEVRLPPQHLPYPFPGLSLVAKEPMFFKEPFILFTLKYMSTYMWRCCPKTPQFYVVIFFLIEQTLEDSE